MPSDQRRNHDWVGAYNFAIELEGLEVALFKAVSGVGTFAREFLVLVLKRLKQSFDVAFGSHLLNIWF